MSELMLGLADAHDIIKADQDLELVLKYAEQLRDCSIIQGCSPHDLNSTIACINSCFNAKNGKLNGLVILQTLVQDCSDEVFQENGQSWIKMVWSSLQKSNNSSLGFSRLACSTMRTLIRRAPNFPDVSRYVTTIVSPIIETLLSIANTHVSLANDVIRTVCVMFKLYPGSCGPSQGHVDKFLLANIVSESSLDKQILAKCLALMPRLGGGGKEGIHHKANFVTMFQKLAVTLSNIVESIQSVAPLVSTRRKKTVQTFVQEPFKLPTINNTDLLKKVLHLQCQFDILCECLKELLKVPFPHTKSVRPGLLFMVLNMCFDVVLSEYVKMDGNEGKVLLFIMPKVIMSSMGVIMTMLETCDKSLVLFVPSIMDKIIGVLSDLRHFTESFQTLRMMTYDLLIQVCETFGAGLGIGHYDKDLIGYIISDVIPPDQSAVTTLKAPTTKGSKKNNKHVVHAIKTSTKLNSGLIISALNALNMIVKVSGSRIEASVYTQLQCVLVSLGLEQENSPSARLPSDVQAKLYTCLVTILEQGHTKVEPSVPLFSTIFKLALHRERDSKVKSICHHGLALCLSHCHPSRMSMHLDLPLEVKTVEEIKQDLMSVHVYYLSDGAGRSVTNLPTFAVVADKEDTPADEPLEAVKSDHPVQLEHTNSKGVQEIADERKRIQESNDEMRDLNERIRIAHSKDTIQDGGDDNDTPSSHEENERLVNEIYKFDNQPIFIPDDIKNRKIITTDTISGEPSKKHPRLDNDNAEESDYLDMNTMLKDFVPKLK
jgi:hypothetical protein